MSSQMTNNDEAKFFAVSEVLNNLRNSIRGLYFPPTKPITKASGNDHDTFSLLCDAASCTSLAKRIDRAAELLMQCARKLDQKEKVSRIEFWTAVGQGKNSNQGELEWEVAQDIVMALVKGRQRYLVRFPEKTKNIDNMPTAFAQHVLNRLSQDTNNCLGDKWKLSKEDQQLSTMDRHLMGPAQQISKNRFKLSVNAAQLLHPIAEIGGETQDKADLLGMAAMIIGPKPSSNLSYQNQHPSASPSQLTPPISLKRERSSSTEAETEAEAEAEAESGSGEERPLKRSRREDSEPPRPVSREAVPRRMAASASPEQRRRVFRRHTPSLFLKRRP